MKMTIEILRRENARSAPYTQTFEYETEDITATVEKALDDLNVRIAAGEFGDTPPVRHECSCLQKKCGACAMLINGYPALACDTKLSAFKGKVSLAPLKKFPVIADLIVDRSAMRQALAEMDAHLDGEAVHTNVKDELAYDASRCLQCGMCLEVCPNFFVGGKFAGTAAMVPLSRLIAQEDKKSEHRKELRRQYDKRFFAGCGKSLACRKVCPANIDIERLLVRHQ